jgi:hypothetical protein
MIEFTQDKCDLVNNYAGDSMGFQYQFKRVENGLVHKRTKYFNSVGGELRSRS